MLRKKVELSRKHGVKSSFSLAVGSASDVIVKFARTEKADFIVMGSSRFPPFQSNKYKKLRILGSVATNVSLLSDCPVMIVK